MQSCESRLFFGRPLKIHFFSQLHRVPPSILPKFIEDGLTTLGSAEQKSGGVKNPFFDRIFSVTSSRGYRTETPPNARPKKAVLDNCDHYPYKTCYLFIFAII